MLTNLARHACALEGYPRLTFLDRHGRALPFVISHGGGGVVVSRRPTRVLIAARHSAFVVFDKYRCDLGPAAMTGTLRLGLPGSRPTKTAPIPSNRAIDYCKGGVRDPGNEVAVSPVVRRPRDATHSG